MKKLIITICTFGLILGSAQAQMGPGGFGTGPGGPPVDVPPPPPELSPPGMDNEIPDEIIALHGEVKALRDVLRESRNAVLEGLSEDATREEKIAALTVWREENSDDISAVREFSEELRALVRENRPGGPGAEVPEEIVALREELQIQRAALAESRKAAIDALGPDATDEDIRAAIDAWREANSDTIANAQTLADELRQWFRENRPGRAGPPVMAGRRAAFRENLRDMHENRRALRTQLQNPDLNDEERQQIMATFREQQREFVQERKTLKRQQRIDQGGVGGDRRPGG